MKKIPSVLALAVLAAAVTVPAMAADAEEDAIRKRGVDFAAAWNKHDAKAMAAFWAPDGDIISPSGRLAKGRAEVERLFTDEHAAHMKGTTYSSTLRTIVLLKPDVAVVTWDASITGMKTPEGGAAPAFNAIVTTVYAKKDGAWWVAAARPMVPLPAPPGAAK